MNVKTKTFLVIVLTLVVGIIIGALANRALLQNRVRRVFSMRSPNVFTQSYLESIKPDAEQNKQIKEILERNGQLLDEIRAKSREDLETVMAAMMSELESVLSPEQLKRLEDRSSRGRVPFGRRSVEDELAFLSSELDLTEDQISKLEKILKTSRIHPPDKKPSGPPMELMTTFREQMQKREEEIIKILTDDQKNKYDELRKNRRKRQPENLRKK